MLWMLLVSLKLILHMLHVHHSVVSMVVVILPNDLQTLPSEKTYASVGLMVNLSASQAHY